jgi:hypothetical protein
MSVSDFNPEIVGQERPMIIVSGPITDDIMDIRQVTLQAGIQYNVDEDGNVRDMDGNFCCKMSIWRKFPHSFLQEEAIDTLAVVDELSSRVVDDDSHYPGWLRANVAQVKESLKSVIGTYKR